MNIRTDAILRLRDHLLSSAPESAGRSADEQPGEVVRKRVEPFAETMFLVMLADDEQADSEHDALVVAVDMLTDGLMGRDAVDALLAEFAERVRQEGREGCVARIGAWLSADRDDREMAFTLAAVIALADDRVEVEENEVLDLIRTYYGISNRRMEAILGTLS
ncbi:MAG: hypothetical protein GWM88_01925 [Pseudomonadales bacterium]|nr:hypothetical protein [Pseudomonadales bacterium]NIX06837.1 hypothetical protein [Pseudomonadales bacterium]